MRQIAATLAASVVALILATRPALAKEYSDADIPFILHYFESHTPEDAFGYFRDASFVGRGRFGYIESKSIGDQQITMTSVMTDYGQVSCIVSNGTVIDISPGTPIRIRSASPGMLGLTDSLMLSKDCVVERLVVAPPPLEQSAPPAPAQLAPEAGLSATPTPKTPTGSAKSFARRDSPVQPAAPESAFDQGYADRAEYQRWRDSLLPGPFRAGALYWEGRRSMPRSRCSRDFSEEFYAGCVADQRMIAPYDRRRLADPEYRAGWDSVPVQN